MTTERKPSDDRQSDDDDVVTMPRGGTAARCRARARSGRRCGMPARSGFQVCFKHGAGTAKRVDAGSKRRPGRPRLHGLYSDFGRASVRDEVRRLEEAQVDLDDTDREMLVAKAVNAYLLNLIEDVEHARADRLNDLHADARRGDDADVTLEKRHEALMHRVAQNSLRIVRMAQTRAATKRLLARDHAMEIVVDYVKAVRHIIWDLLDDQALDVYEERLRDEVFRPLGVEVDLPARPAASADLVVPSSGEVDLGRVPEVGRRRES